MSLRFLMMIRKVSATYRVTNSLVVPGFYPEAGFMGQSGMGGGLYAPGYDFAFGFIDDQFMEKASSRGWLSMNDSIVQPATAAYTSDFDIKINLEPIPGLKIDLNGKRYEANTTSIQYMYEGMPETFTGSYNITQIALTTAFSSIGNAKNNYSSKNYERFLEYRDIMTDRLQQKYVYFPVRRIYYLLHLRLDDDRCRNLLQRLSGSLHRLDDLHGPFQGENHFHYLLNKPDAEDLRHKTRYQNRT